MPLGTIATYCVLACWIVLFVALVFRKRPPKAREIRRASGWAGGLLLQTLAISVVWGMRRRPAHAIAGMAPELAAPFAVLAVILAVASTWFMIRAQRALGRQFAYEPRLVEEHRLITTGPYGKVRHPIYTGLYGLTLGTALAYSALIAIPIFTALFALGTALRVKKEERLLRDAFGPAFENYAQRVPAVVPRLF